MLRSHGLGLVFKSGLLFHVEGNRFYIKEQNSVGENKLLSRLENEVKILKLQIHPFKRQRRRTIGSEQKACVIQLKPLSCFLRWGLKGGEKEAQEQRVRSFFAPSPPASSQSKTNTQSSSAAPSEILPSIPWPLTHPHPLTCGVLSAVLLVCVCVFGQTALYNAGWLMLFQNAHI